jgi:hypothetical protein
LSQEELVAAYLDGQMSRRTLIRRLAAGGISIGAAVGYAHLLAPRATGSARLLGGEHYDVDVEILDDDLDTVVKREGVRVKVLADRPMEVQLELRLLRKPEHTEYENSVVGTDSLIFKGAGAHATRIPLQYPFSPNALKAVKIERREREKARFRVIATSNAEGPVSTYVDEKTIRR